jgi:hypothetical protein
MSKSKLIIILIFISTNFSFFGQDINILDEKNGYKIFKINSVKSDYENNLTFIETINGYSSYNFSYKEEYLTEYDTIILENSKNTLESVARYFKTSINVLKSLNKDLIYVGAQVGESRLKKGQKIIYPVKKLAKKHTVDTTLFELFGNKINSIILTFDNNTNQLKKISLDLTKNFSRAYYPLIGKSLSDLYYNFENIIGITTDRIKPPKDCVSTNCAFFEQLSIKGEITWSAKYILLNITSFAEIKFNDNGEVYMQVNKTVSFKDKSLLENKSSF